MHSVQNIFHQNVTPDTSEGSKTSYHMKSVTKNSSTTSLRLPATTNYSLFLSMELIHDGCYKQNIFISHTEMVKGQHLLDCYMHIRICTFKNYS